jgi:multidrug efflux pump subunit AcrB
MASQSAMAGHQVTTLCEGDKQIPVVAKLRMEERAKLDDLNNLYVYSAQGSQKLLMRQVASWEPMCYAQIGGLSVATFYYVAVGTGDLCNLRA